MPLSDFLYTDGVDDVMAEHVNRLTASLLRGELGEAINITTQLALTDGDFPYLKITPDAALNVLLPPEAGTNHLHVIENGSGSNTLTIKDDSGVTTFAVLEPGQFSLFVPTGVTWKVLKRNNDTSTNGWIDVFDTWAYASASTITVPSGATSKYPKWCKIRFKQGGGYKYFIASTVADTLITVLVNNDYTVANSAITDVAYSLMDSPLGFPTKFAYTSAITYTGGTTDPTSNTVTVANYNVSGGRMHIHIQSNLVRGTGNRTVTKWSMPVNQSVGNAAIPGLNSITAAGLKVALTFTNGTDMQMTETMANDGTYYINGSFILL